jgi:putative tributyrin esterase
LLVLALGSTLASAQVRPPDVTWSTTVEEFKLQSKLMGRQMPYRVVVPHHYKRDRQKNAVVIYLLHGLTGHYVNWTDKTKLKEYAAKYDFVVVTPEGNDGWYTDSVSTSNDKYESYLVQELFPTIEKEFNTLGDREHRIIAGLSMGGYGAIKFGLKYPEKFALVGSFSGALGAASFNEKNAGTIGKSIDLIFGPEGGAPRAANDIFAIIRDATTEKIKAMPFIYQSCGTEDFLFQNNRDFVALLIEKKVPHEYRQHPGGHDWKFWDTQVREFLQVAESRTKK